MRTPETQAATLRESAFNDYTIGGGQLETFVSTTRWLADHDIDVAIVLMPASSQYLDLHPSGEEDYGRFVAAMTQLSELEEIPLLEADSGYGDEEFADILHLNAQGSQHLTMQIADWITQLVHQQLIGPLR